MLIYDQLFFDIIRFSKKDDRIINIFIRSFIILITLALFFSSVHSQAAFARPDKGDRFQEIDSFINKQMADLNIPGVAIGIVEGNEVRYVQGYGVADEEGRKITSETPFLIASLSKPITASAIMQLVESEKLILDSPIQTYLPWFEVANPDFSSRITIRHLLNHTSGFSERNGYKRNLVADTDTNALENSIRNLRTEKLQFPPGEKFEYSNTNYDILGLIIQAVSGKSYETYIEENLFIPLEMKDSYTSLELARTGNLTDGYFPFFGFQASSTSFMPYSKVTKPSAGLFSSAKDLTHFLMANLNQGRYLEKQILSPIQFSEYQLGNTKTNENSGYVTGWTVFPFEDLAPAMPDGEIPIVLSHGGEWVGYTALMIIVPAVETGLVMLINKSDISQTKELFNIGWALTMLAVELDPIAFPTSDFASQNIHWLIGIIILLLSFNLIWSIRLINYLSKNPLIKLQRNFIAQIVYFAAFDLIIAGSLLFIQLPRTNDTLLLSLHFNSDIGIMYFLILVLTLGWGIIRTTIFLLNLSSSKSQLAQ